MEVPSNLTGEGIKKAIIDKKPTKLIVVSLVLANAIEELKKSQHLIESIMLSSSSASVELKQSLMKMKTNIYEMYGASEVGTATVKKITDSDMKSLGKTLEDTDLIIDQETNEIRVQTKNICVGYLNKELELYRIFNENEYFQTGDIGRFSKTGELEYLGRLDKEFKSGGIKINPYSIEQKVLKANVKNIIDCVCIGVEDRKLEKVIAMYLIVKTKLKAEEIKLIKLSILKIVDKYEMPRYLKVTDEVYRLENGKLDRNRVEKDMVKYVDSLR